jgi:WD40-like Beta Propeller Repeat
MDCMRIDFCRSRGVVVAALVVAVAASTTVSANPSRPHLVARPSVTAAVTPSVTFSPRSRLARINIRGGQVTMETSARDFAAVGSPAFSPSGRLVFVASACSTCSSWLFIREGMRVRKLSRATGAQWLDDRTLIASMPTVGPDAALRVVPLDGRSRAIGWLKRAAERAGIEDQRDPSVDRAGSMIIFSGEGLLEHHRLFRLDLRRRLLLPLAGDSMASPAISPDGRRIAYSQLSRHGRWNICIADLSGGTLAHPQCDTRHAGDDRSPAWLPDGRRIVFVSDRADHRNAINSLYLLDLRTNAVRRLTHTGFDAGSPAVGPDGRHVVFVLRRLVPLR